MTRNLPEPLPNGIRKVDPLESVIRDLREQLVLQRRTGVSYIRVHSNQGGVTAAKAFFEEPLPPNS